MGGIHVTYEIVDSVHYVPLTSRAYFASFQEIFLDVLHEDVLPSILILAKFGVLLRVAHWSKIQLEFFKIRQYLRYLRKTIGRKKFKAEMRVKVKDGADACRMCQDHIGNDNLYLMVSHLVMDQAHDQFMNAMTFPGGLENSVITSFAMAVQRINAYQLLVSNYEMPNVEYKVMSSLERTVDKLQGIVKGHLIIAFLTNTVYIICLLKLYTYSCSQIYPSVKCCVMRKAKSFTATYVLPIQQVVVTSAPLLSEYHK